MDKHIIKDESVVPTIAYPNNASWTHLRSITTAILEHTQAIFSFVLLFSVVDARALTKKTRQAKSSTMSMRLGTFMMMRISTKRFGSTTVTNLKRGCDS